MKSVPGPRPTAPRATADPHLAGLDWSPSVQDQTRIEERGRAGGHAHEERQVSAEMCGLPRCAGSFWLSLLALPFRPSGDSSSSHLLHTFDSRPACPFASRTPFPFACRPGLPSFLPILPSVHVKQTCEVGGCCVTCKIGHLRIVCMFRAQCVLVCLILFYQQVCVCACVRACVCVCVCVHNRALLRTHVAV